MRDGGTPRRRWIDGVTNWTNPAGSTIAITSEERRTSDAKRAADFRISSSLTRASAMASPAMLSARRRLCTSTSASDPASKLSSTPPISTMRGAVADGVGDGASELTRTVKRSPRASTVAVRTSARGAPDVSSNVDGADPNERSRPVLGAAIEEAQSERVLGRALQVTGEEIADDDDASPPLDVGTAFVDGGGSRRGAEHRCHDDDRARDRP